MYYSKRALIVGAVAAIAGGVELHFVYDWIPNGVTALFAPVKESLWEHVKILFWPYLAVAAVLTRGRPGGLRPWLLTLLLMCGTMLAVAYAYHVLLGGETVAVDIGLYVLLMLFGFWLAPRFSGAFRGVRWQIPLVLTAVLGVLLWVFALRPPVGVLFEDLSAVRTWLRLPV